MDGRPIPTIPERAPKPAAEPLPRSLFAFILKLSAPHQVVLVALTVAVFLLNAAPLEVQRRLVNDALGGGSFATIVTLVLVYVGLALAEGLIKLGLNYYRGWVGERAVLYLRRTVLAGKDAQPRHVAAEDGVDISIVLAESDPIGAFVGGAFSEPLLQAGVLVSVISYMAYLQPIMVVPGLVVLLPQFVFVPLMQRAVNRRAASRILTLREIGVGIAEHSEAHSRLSLQIDRATQAFALNMGIYKFKFTMNFLMNLSYHVGIGLVLLLGGYLVLNKEADIGTVLACLTGLEKLNDPWGELVNWFRDMAVTRTKYGLVYRARPPQEAVVPPGTP
ncbi:ABC transporter ATP-binding protein [Segnochrobactrum spirostomi]|uniref:ABC transporter ATP-binding protein n=1 Tax=Segnochrobactrum spirostomi TaxID=2608987 RepID=A0A6A7XYD1_9HYPH|nr:ABC transporter ATP-binding protein [Segnochrobactrum spirostomi]MQT11710.1 ABC transporter ATP-binding protein [Segnochrobactrum spirostomi]